jgi:predicted N-formylglutamate amidohydrolase
LKIIFTCEHAGNEIPDSYSHLFRNATEVLETHRGFDPGALDLFISLSGTAEFGQPYMISRLLVEPNRSIGHPQLFSEFTRNLSEPQKEQILEDFYYPYRHFIEDKIAAYIKQGEDVVHISVHSFTPELNGEIREADIGLLFDPERLKEVEICSNLKENNYPYLGTDDGFTTHLRKVFPQQYSGIELEVNQKFVENNRFSGKFKKHLQHAFTKTFKE